MSKRPIRNYSGWRPAVERLHRTLTPNPWPARLVGALGLYQPVQVSRHLVRAGQPLGGATRLRIAFASDFHAGPTTVGAVLADAVARLREAAPDLLLLGGDFVSLEAHYAEALAQLLDTVPAPLGRFAVLGNHDHWAGGARIEAVLEAASVTMLTNRAAHLPPPFDRVSIVGVDDHMSGHPDASAAFRDAGPVRIVLMHQPSNLLDLGTAGFRLALAGHTHGGQVVLPGGWRPVLPWGTLSRVYPGGFYELDRDRALLVSRGVGCTTLPVRINAPPEVHVIDLEGAAGLPSVDVRREESSP